MAKARCVALLSGGLDSMLAVRLMQEQGLEVEALNFKTMFTCCQDQAGQAAHWLGTRLTVIGHQDDYLELIRRPRFGYGKGANPCVDCRIYMFDKAKRFMEDVGAQFLVSGELLGQRPMSQKRGDLRVISHHAGVDDLLLRPLSAKLLPPTLPERQGLVDRERLYGFHGRGRQPLIALARKFGFPKIPAPSTGCALTESLFSQKVRDLLAFSSVATPWEFEILKLGRHFRFNDRVKVVVGRSEVDNERLTSAHAAPGAKSSARLWPFDFVGPTALVLGPPDEEALAFAAGLARRYGKRFADDNPRVVVAQAGVETLRPAPRHARADAARTLGDEPVSPRSSAPGPTASSPS